MPGCGRVGCPLTVNMKTPGQHPIAGGPERNAGGDLSELSRSATRRQEAGMALSASSMVIASPPRSRCPASYGRDDVRDIGQPVLAEVDSRTSRAEASSVTDETATATKQDDIAWSDERQAFFRTLGECPVPGAILARRNEYTFRSLQRRNRGQRQCGYWRVARWAGLAYICPPLGFPCVLVAFVAVVWAARSTFGPSAVCLARSPGSGIRGNRGNRDRC
jgi:hypothetical protein